MPQKVTKSTNAFAYAKFWAFLSLLLLATGCIAWMSSFQSAFFSNFSLKELVKRNESIGLRCSEGGGGGDGISTGAGGIGKQQSSFHKGESVSCQIADVTQFDEVKLIQALKQSVQKELDGSKAKIVSSEDPETTRFSFEYALKDITGRVEISGTRAPGNYYSLSATLDEKNGIE